MIRELRMIGEPYKDQPGCSTAITPRHMEQSIQHSGKTDSPNRVNAGLPTEEDVRC